METVLAKQHGKSLLERYYAAPDGQVDTFTLFTQRDWSVVLAITSRDDVLTVEQFKHGCGSYTLELPAGTPNFAEEKPEEVMRRELLEETGYEAKEVVGFLPFYPATQGSPTRFFPFVAFGCEYKKKPTRTKAETIRSDSLHLGLWLRLIWGANYESLNYAMDIEPRPVKRWDRIFEPSAVVTTMLALPELLRRGMVEPGFLETLRAEPDNRKE